MFSTLNRQPCRLFPKGEAWLYEARSGDETIIVCRRERHHRYRKGVAARIENLVGKYGLNDATIESGGVFIDYGSNMGELGFWARRKNMTYVAFEPEPPPAHCVDLNHFGGEAKARRVALWHRRETLEFFSTPEAADNSAFDTEKTRESRPAEALPLNEAGVDLTGPGTHILKLEAEGAEPEILNGAKETLKTLHYIAAEFGYERGVEQRHTFVEVCNRLLPLGFRLVATNLGKCPVLFEKVPS